MRLLLIDQVNALTTARPWWRDGKAFCGDDGIGGGAPDERLAVLITLGNKAGAESSPISGPASPLRRPISATTAQRRDYAVEALRRDWVDVPSTLEDMMPLAQHDQTTVGQKACGASCIMCAAYELGTYAGPVDDTMAQYLYKLIWRTPQDESLVSKVAGVLAMLKLRATLIENKAMTGKSGMFRNPSSPLNTIFEPQYQAYKSDVKLDVDRIRRTGPVAFTDDDFNDEARLMLIVILPSQGLTHWVLARKYNGTVTVMNPDQGTESQDSGLISWMNTPTAQTHKIGNVDYLFAGIVLRVTRGT